mgnify:FL=1|jgi:thiamine biosynthesis lipoprotein
MNSKIQESELLKFSFKAMGSDCEFILCLTTKSDSHSVFSSLRDELERLEQKYSKFRENNLLFAINLAASKGETIQVDEETESLLEHSLNCFNQSDGLFDITAGSLNSLWDFKKKKVPTTIEIEHALSLTDFSRVSWGNGMLSIPMGMSIDFGGVVKEYAADSLAVLSKKLGVEYGLINLGGDIAVVGRKPDGSPWNVGITDPRNTDAEIATIEVHSGGLATSGDYKRYFVHEGKRYSHILNPKTGIPCSGLRAVSVSANLCTVAGSVATIAMLKEESEAIAWLRELGLPFVIMNSNSQIMKNSC